MAEVVTGEAVVLDLAVARFPSRALALLIDVVVQLPALFFLEVIVFRKAAEHLNTASAAALYLFGFVLIVIGYPVIFETLSRGKSLGKLALGIRVVSDDGSPERMRQALIRALAAAFVEIWLPPFNVFGLPAGLITSMVSAKGKRLGDLFAGTFVIQERVTRRPDLAPAFAIVPPPLAEWARHLEISRLSDQTAASVNSYLRRFADLRPAARAEIGMQLASAVAAQVSPPPPLGTPPEAYLAAVLAVRREREQVRLSHRQAAQAAQATQAAHAAQAPQATQAWQAVQPVQAADAVQPVQAADAVQPVQAAGAVQAADSVQDAATAVVRPPDHPEPEPGAPKAETTHDDYGFIAPS